MKPLEIITFSSDITAWQSCIRGMRITVSLVLSLIASGMSTSDILEDYPDLEDEDIRECLRYASWLAQERQIAFT